VGERVEGDREVDDAGRAGRDQGLERRLPRRRSGAPAQAFGANELANRVVARTRQPELPSRLADLPPRLGSRNMVAIEAHDERVQAGIAAAHREVHHRSVTVVEDRLITNSSRGTKRMACV
jgi:hypothetical protein